MTKFRVANMQVQHGCLVGLLVTLGGLPGCTAIGALQADAEIEGRCAVLTAQSEVCPDSFYRENAISQSPTSVVSGAFMSDRIDLSPEERAKLTTLMDDAHYNSVPAYALDNPESNRRVKFFYVALDGTNNDRERDYNPDPTKNEETHVARFERVLKANKPNNVESRYYPGVGTRSPWPLNMVEQAFGFGCEKRAEQAYEDLVDQVKNWQKDNPNVLVHVHTTGFSRGAASGLHLMNLIEERGIPGQNGEKVSFRQTAALMDAVATGQESTLKLGVPPSVRQVFHLTAEDEHRRLFSLTTAVDPGRKNSITVAQDVLVLPSFSGAEGSEPTRTSAMFARVVEKAMPGAHSDIGGSYPDGKLKDVSAYLMSQYHQQLGLPIVYDRPSEDTLAKAYKHDSRWTIDHILDGLRGKIALRDFNEQAPVGWTGDALVIALRKEVPAAGNLTALDSQIKLSPDTPNEYFKGPANLHIYLYQGEVRFESNRPELFSYDAKNDRMLVAGQPAAVLGVTSDLKYHLGAGEMRFEFLLQRSNLYYMGKDNEQVTVLSRGEVPNAPLASTLAVVPPNTVMLKKQEITALMLAARAGLTEVVQSMMEKGGNPYFRNAEGKNALDLARTNMLRQYMRENARMAPDATISAKDLERNDFQIGLQKAAVEILTIDQGRGRDR